MKRYYLYEDLPELPPKTYRYWGRFNQDLIQQRMKGLENYMKQILQVIPSDNALLREFLDVESHFLSYHLNSSQNPTEIISQIDFMDRVYSNFTHLVIHFNPQWRLDNCSGSGGYGNSSASSAAQNKRYLKSQAKRKNSKKKFSSSSSTSAQQKRGDDFRMLSLVSSHIDLDDDTESLRDSFRDSYLSESGDSVWRDVDGEGDEMTEDGALDSLLSSSLKLSPHPGLIYSSSVGRDVLDLLSRPISIPSSTLQSVISLVSNPLLVVPSFPSLSDLVIKEFSIFETLSPPPSPSKPKKPSKRRAKKGSSSTTGTVSPSVVAGAVVEEEDEVQALRIRQTKNDSGRDLHPSNSAMGSRR
jgi:hypothetical protein